MCNCRSRKQVEQRRAQGAENQKRISRQRAERVAAKTQPAPAKTAK